MSREPTGTGKDESQVDHAGLPCCCCGTSTRSCDVRTPALAVELLASCRLNRVEMGDFNYHTVTRLNPQQRHLLGTLELVELADDNAIEKQISPR